MARLPASARAARHGARRSTFAVLFFIGLPSDAGQAFFCILFVCVCETGTGCERELTVIVSAWSNVCVREFL